MTEQVPRAILEKRARHAPQSSGRTPPHVPAVRRRGLGVVRVPVAAAEDKL